MFLLDFNEQRDNQAKQFTTSNAALVRISVVHCVCHQTGLHYCLIPRVPLLPFARCHTSYPFVDIITDQMTNSVVLVSDVTVE